MTNALNHVHLSVNPAYNEIYGKARPPGDYFSKGLMGLGIHQRLSFQLFVLFISARFVSGPQAATQNHVPAYNWNLPILSSTREHVATETLYE